MNNEGAAGCHGPSGRGEVQTWHLMFGLYFWSARLPGDSNCVRQTSHIFADIIRAHLQTLRRIYVYLSSKIAVFNLSEKPKLMALCAVTISCGWNPSVGPGSSYGGLLNADKNGLMNRTQKFLWHAEH